VGVVQKKKQWKQGCKREERDDAKKGRAGHRESEDGNPNSKVEVDIQGEVEHTEAQEGSKERLGFVGGARQIIKVKYGKARIRYHRYIFSLARGRRRHSNNVWCGQQPAAVKGETGTGVYFWQPAKFSLSSPHLT
jgi:hypothetical protein